MMNTMTGPELLGDEAWRPELPAVSCPVHGYGWLSWWRGADGVRLTCAGSRPANPFVGAVCDMGPQEAAGTAHGLVLHSNGLAYAVRVPAVTS